MLIDEYKSHPCDLARRLLDNIKLTSDNASLNECYYLCANRQHIDELRSNDDQVIWGRRGTGKTTLLKAFTYEINTVVRDPKVVAVYMLLSQAIPTDTEIGSVMGDGSILAAYVYTNILLTLLKEIEIVYNTRKNGLDRDQESRFLDEYCLLCDYIDTYQKYILGGECEIESLKSSAIKNEVAKEGGVEGSVTVKVLKLFGKLKVSKGSIIEQKSRFNVSGKIQFILETKKINSFLIDMMDSLSLDRIVLCLDEYSEIDKVSEFSIQSKLAELLKQTFFKNNRFTVKIATIWNKTKFQGKGGPGTKGIEYKQDIFPGPDLDVMFMGHNTDIVQYFKTALINTYYMGEKDTDTHKKILQEFIVNRIFGDDSFRQLICGAQGVSRAFMVMVHKYLTQFINNNGTVLKSLAVYEIIKCQYIEDVRYKICTDYSVYRVIEKYITDNIRRYFLIKRDDYVRCKDTIRYLNARGYLMQIHGHNTDRRIRDSYKLFIIHYGCYLDALETENYKSGRKQIASDATLTSDTLFIPEYSKELFTEPEKYTVELPAEAEDEVYCQHCEKIFKTKEKVNKKICPNCGSEILPFDMFINDVGV